MLGLYSNLQHVVLPLALSKQVCMATAAKRVDFSQTARLSVNRYRPIKKASIQTFDEVSKPYNV